MKHVDCNDDPIDIGDYVFLKDGSRIHGGFIKRLSENIFVLRDEDHAIVGTRLNPVNVALIRKAPHVCVRMGA